MASTFGRSIWLATLACLVVVWVNPSQAMQCQVPQWQDSLGPNPMTSRGGKVVVVALLKAYCGFCIQQAQRLESMKGALRQEGYPDVDVIVVNGGDRRSRRLAANMINATSLEVLQDRSDHVMYREIFRGDKDDFLVYDRCGQAVVYIPYPYSNLDYSVTKRVVKRIHSGQHSCYCSLDYPDSDQASGNTGDDVMAGDDPSAYVAPSRNGQDDVMMGDDPRAYQWDDGIMGRFQIQTPRFPRMGLDRVEGTRFRPPYWNRRRGMGMRSGGGGSLGESTRFGRRGSFGGFGRRGSFGGFGRRETSGGSRRNGNYRESRRGGLFGFEGSRPNEGNENAFSFADMLERQSRMAFRGAGFVEPRQRPNMRPETQSAETPWWTRRHGPTAALNRRRVGAGA